MNLDPTRIMITSSPPRRRWPWIFAAVVCVVILAAVFVAPQIACRMVQWQCPIQSDGVVIRGARYGGTPAAAAMVVGQCAPYVFKRIVEGASGRWLPSVVLSEGQHVGGTFTDAPEVTWRLDLNATADEPRITARIPQALAERLLAEQLKRARSPVSEVTLAEVSLTGEPHDADTVWQAHLRGAGKIMLWNQPSDIDVENMAITVTTTFTPRSDGDHGLTTHLDITDMRGNSPFGPLMPFALLIQKQANQDLGREMPKVLVPGWWPTPTHWDLKIVPGGVEF